jgi:cobalt-zinc-cadmium efflux system membrane fusion protein
MTRRNRIAVAALAAAALGGLGFTLASSRGSQEASVAGPARSKNSEPVPAVVQTLELRPDELEQFKILPAEERIFTIRRETVGSIDFNQELSVDVFPPVQGKILKVFVSAGDDVKTGAPLYTIDSPDLVQAGSQLISAAGVLDLTTKALKRARELQGVEGISQKDLEQAVSDQQAAEASLRAARDAVRIFGKTDQEMEAIVAQRKIDSELVVHSPIAGRVTARNAAPGLLAQPGVQPAPLTLSDVLTLWMLADVAENDFALLRLGLPVEVSVKAYPGRSFHGKIVNIGASVDPSTRRVPVRSEVRDPGHELRPGMFATFVITAGETRSPAVPRRGVIREGDGTMCVWTTSDRKTVTRRAVKTGLEQDGYVQVLEGVPAGSLVVTDQALFLSSALNSSPQ